MVPLISLRAFLFLLLLWAMLTMAFGWAVKTGIADGEQAGPLRSTAVMIASFPKMVEEVLGEVDSYLDGSYQDEAIRVRREESADYAGFAPVPVAPGIDVEGVFMRARPAEMVEGWRLLAGGFSIDGEVSNAALLLSPELEIVKVWILHETTIGEVNPRAGHRKIVHGIEVLGDGSLIFSFDGGMSLQRFDACGQRRWATAGPFTHAVTLDGTGEAVWTVNSPDAVALVSIDDGSLRRQITMGEVIAANPDIDILELRSEHRNQVNENSRNTVGRWLMDPFHINDVDPLPAAIADTLAGLDAGDLLVSARSLNLLFVIDPDTLKVKWWRVGAVQRQHDPDWLPNGEILVLNNRMSRDFSEIVSIDPGTFERTVVFDGRKNDFYTRIRGKQQQLADGSIVVASPQQGRAFEVSPDGDITFEIVNLKPGSNDTNYVITEMKWLPPDYFGKENWKCPRDS